MSSPMFFARSFSQVISLIIHEVPLELWLQVTQIGIKDPFRQQLFDVGDALVSQPFEFCQRQGG